MKRCWMLLVPVAMVFATTASATEFRCHSEQFTKAKQQLERLVLTSAQKDAIATYEASFWKKWRHTHSEKGCAHHEAHAQEFIAAAAGVLTNDQFKRFRGRERTEAEQLQNEIWQTGVYLDNLLKLAKSA